MINKIMIYKNLGKQYKVVGFNTFFGIEIKQDKKKIIKIL